MSRLLLVLLVLVLLLLGVSFYAYVAYDPQVETALDASEVLPEGAGFAPKPSMDRWQPMNRLGRRLHDWLGERRTPKLDEVKVVATPVPTGPVGGLEVRVRHPNGDLARAIPVTVYVPAGVDPQAPQWTDHEGIARFRDLPSGPGYVVEATVDGTWLGAGLSTRSGARVEAGVSVEIELVFPGQTIEGTVVDHLTGEPAPDATITASVQPPPDKDFRAHVSFGVGRRVKTVGTSRSDAEGKFTLRSIPVGPHIELLAQTTDGRTGITSGDFKGEPKPPLQIRVGRLPPLKGTVVDEDGAPVSGALVRVATQDGETRTDSWGAFVLERTLPWMVVVVADEARGTALSHMLDWENVLSDVRLRFPRRTALAVRAVDSSGNAVAGATVIGSAAGGAGALGGHYWVQATTDADGRARIPVLAGELKLVQVARAESSISFDPEEEGGPHGFRRPLDFQNPILAGEDREVLLALPRELELRGRTVLSDGRPAVRVPIGMENGLPGAEATAVAGDDGRFVLRVYPPDVVDGEVPEWNLTARIELVAGATLDLTPRLDSARSAALDVGDVTLRSRVMVRGRVVDADGTPVAGARVRTGYFSAHPDVLTDTQGVYRLPVEARKWLSLTASAEGWREREVSVKEKLVPGCVHDVQPIFLRRAVTLRVHVRAPNGSPIAGARVQMPSRSGVATSSLPATDAAGWVELRGYTEADLSQAQRNVDEVQSMLSRLMDYGLGDSERLCITLPDGMVVERGLRVPEAAPDPFEVLVVAPGRLVLEGVVRDEAGASVGGVEVEARVQVPWRGARSPFDIARAPWAAHHAETDATGRFRLEVAAVPGESWSISAEHDDGRVASEVVVLPKAGPLDLVLRPARGLLTSDKEGRGIEGAK